MKLLAPPNERGRVANFASDVAERLQKPGSRAKKPRKVLSYGLEERDLVPGLPPLLPHYDGRYWASVNKTGLVKCWHFWAQALTPGGRWLAGASVAFFSVGSTSLDLQVFVPLCYVVSLWGLALLARLFARPSAEVEARLATRVGAHEPLPVSVKVTCTGKYLSRARLVADRLPPHFEVRPADGIELPPLSKGESQRVGFEIVPTKRGAWNLRGLRIESDAPFAMLNAARVFPLNACVLVHPTFTPLRQFELPTGHAHHPGGVALASSRGDAMEFWGNREWRQGDRLRDIDWRATARLRRPLDQAIVREYREEWLSRVGVILDTHVAIPKGARDATVFGLPLGLPRRKSGDSEGDFERAVSVAAAVGDFLARSDYMVDIFAAGPELFSLSAGRSLAYLDQILDILAQVEPSDEGGWELLGGALDEYLAQVTTLVCVMLDWDEERRAFVRGLLQEGAAVRLVVVRDAEPTLHPDADADWLGPASVIRRADFENGIHDL